MKLSICNSYKTYNSYKYMSRIMLYNNYRVNARISVYNSKLMSIRIYSRINSKTV